MPQKYRLRTDNPHLNGANAVVEEVYEHYVVVAWSKGGKTGTYRAMPDELVPVLEEPDPKFMGYTGDVCGRCGGSKMTRTGTCVRCLDCGETSGGCS